MHRLWRGEPVGDGDKKATPTPVNDDRVPILIGGAGDQLIRRAVEWGAGWTMAGSTPDTAAEGADRVRTAWREAGRSGEPRVAALGYFSLGAKAQTGSREYLLDDNGWLGDYASAIADGALPTEDAGRARSRHSRTPG